ncbi:MAG: serine hydrolase domain-containing protein [Dysgonomonas sp.]
MNRILVLVISIAAISLFSCKRAIIETNSLAKNIDSLLEIKPSKPFNGIILIAKDGKTEYLKTCGYSDLDKKTSLKIDDQFVIGSVSKQFTAAIVLQEYDKGYLDLHTPIKKYLPDLSQSWADTVTIHHLLTHTHGIVSLDKPTVFPVGTKYEYSQIGYDLLAKIVERTSGKSFVELSSDLFKKWNMNHTFHPEKKEYQNLVRGYIENDEGKLEYTNESLKQYPAAGAFISSAEDLMHWNQYFFEAKLLNENTFLLMTTKQDKAIRNHPIFGLTEYGYGITIDDKDGIIQWGQTGFAPGFVSMNYYFPQNKTSVIVLENVNYDVSDLKKTFYYHVQILDFVRNEVLKEITTANFNRL